MADLATLKTRLTEAETAYHALMTGQSVVSVDVQDMGKTTYQAADAPKLAAYIQSLQSQIAVLEGASTRRLPFRFQL